MEYKSSKLFNVFIEISTLDLYISCACIEHVHLQKHACTCMHGNVHFDSFLFTFYAFIRHICFISKRLNGI